MSAPTPSGSPADDGPVARLIEMADRPTVGQRLISWASRPPGRLYLPACTVAAGILVYSASFPGWNLVTLGLGALTGGLLAAMGALRLGIALTIARPMILRFWLRWITAPLIAVGTIGLVLTDLPLQARINTSAEALLETGVDIPDETTLELHGERVGLFNLESATVHDGTMRFAVSRAGVLRTHGLAHSEEPLETDVFIPGHGNLVYTHVDGPWYVWLEY